MPALLWHQEFPSDIHCVEKIVSFHKTKWKRNQWNKNTNLGSIFLPVVLPNRLQAFKCLRYVKVQRTMTVCPHHYVCVLITMTVCPHHYDCVSASLCLCPHHYDCVSASLCLCTHHYDCVSASLWLCVRITAIAARYNITCATQGLNCVSLSQLPNIQSARSSSTQHTVLTVCLCHSYPLLSAFYHVHNTRFGLCVFVIAIITQCTSLDHVHNARFGLCLYHSYPLLSAFDHVHNTRFELCVFITATHYSLHLITWTIRGLDCVFITAIPITRCLWSRDQHADSVDKCVLISPPVWGWGAQNNVKMTPHPLRW